LQCIKLLLPLSQALFSVSERGAYGVHRGIEPQRRAHTALVDEDRCGFVDGVAAPIQ
jgi:hypothetical protein